MHLIKSVSRNTFSCTPTICFIYNFEKSIFFYSLHEFYHFFHYESSIVLAFKNVPEVKTWPHGNVCIFYEVADSYKLFDLWKILHILQNGKFAGIRTEDPN